MGLKLAVRVGLPDTYLGCGALRLSRKDLGESSDHPPASGSVCRRGPCHNVARDAADFHSRPYQMALRRPIHVTWRLCTPLVALLRFCPRDLLLPPRMPMTAWISPLVGYPD